MSEKLCVIILAAGLGTRMKSDRAKVLHELNGKSMIEYVVETARTVAGDNVVVVVGHQAEEVKNASGSGIRFALQEEQNGTGHAAMCAVPQVSDGTETIIILCGDVPLLRVETLKKMYEKHLEEKRDATVLAVEFEDSTGYGRIIKDEKGNLVGIVEEADASLEQKRIKTVNSGIYCVYKSFLIDALEKVDSDNAQNEYYLTDIIGIGHAQKKSMGVFESDDADQVVGINSKKDLDEAENLLIGRIKNKS